MKSAPIFVLLILLIAILSCRSSSPKKVRHSDPFYNDTGEGKFLVVPLIKPYSIVMDENSSLGWMLHYLEKPQLIDDKLYLSIPDVEKIAVEKGVIMVYAPNYPWYWVVIIPAQKIEEGFEHEEDFLSYIHQFGIEEPNWVDPLDAFRQFERTGCLDWIPDCP